MIEKKTLVIGGSQKPERYSNKAIRKLRGHGIEVVSIGLKEAQVEDITIGTGMPEYNDIHTVTLYIGPAKLDAYFDYIKGLQPKRIIFNPGTEHMRLAKKFEQADIETVFHCTLIMLAEGSY